MSPLARRGAVLIATAIAAALTQHLQAVLTPPFDPRALLAYSRMAERLAAVEIFLMVVIIAAAIFGAKSMDMGEISARHFWQVLIAMTLGAEWLGRGGGFSTDYLVKLMAAALMVVLLAALWLTLRRWTGKPPR